MKKVGVLSLLLILFVVTVIANNPLASALSDLTGPDDPPLNQSVPVEGKESKALIPSPSLMLLIGSGLVGLIIYRKKYKDRK
jgi:hypothetical protein